MASVVAFNTAVRAFQRAGSDEGKKLSKAEAARALTRLVGPGVKPGKTHLAAVRKLLEAGELTPGAKTVLQDFLKAHAAQGAPWRASAGGGVSDSPRARKAIGDGSGLTGPSSGGRNSSGGSRPSGGSSRSSSSSSRPSFL